MEKENVYYATGKRKNAVAKTWMKYGNGNITINNHSVDQYFKVRTAGAIVMQPLALTKTLETFDIKVNVHGGGFAGQAGAVRHGITKALLIINPDLRQVLKKAGFIKRDPRVKERKKYGQKGARARFQFSKR